MKTVTRIAWLILVCSVFFSCKKDNSSDVSSIEGTVSSYDYEDYGIGGAKVRLIDPSGNEQVQVAVTASDGRFKFEGLSQKKYKIEVQKDGWTLLRIRYGGNLDDLSSAFSTIEGNELSIDNGQSMKVRLVMMNESSGYEEAVTITDYEGNVLSGDIYFPIGATTTSIWINNITYDSVSWWITVPEEDDWWITTNVVPQEGKIAPQMSQLVVFSVDPNEYEENYIGLDYIPVTIWAGKRGHYDLYQWKLVFR